MHCICMSMKKLLKQKVYQTACGSFDMGLISTITMSDLGSAQKIRHRFHIV